MHFPLPLSRPFPQTRLAPLSKMDMLEIGNTLNAKTCNPRRANVLECSSALPRMMGGAANRGGAANNPTGTIFGVSHQIFGLLLAVPRSLSPCHVTGWGVAKIPADIRREPRHGPQLLPADPEKQGLTITKPGSMGNSTVPPVPHNY